jgi:hypothetical protein
MPITGTSFAAPTALRTGIALKAHFGKLLTPLAIKALLLHRADDAGHDKTEVGWGRIPEDVKEIVLTDEHGAHIVYQGELRPASWVRMAIPIPTNPMTGMVEITATFCFATPTDPQDPLNYTRSGLEVRFRPHDQNRSDPAQIHPDSSYFFQAKDVSVETDLRADAHKWETDIAQDPQDARLGPAQPGIRCALQRADRRPERRRRRQDSLRPRDLDRVEKDARPLQQNPPALPDDPGAPPADRRNTDPHMIGPRRINPTDRRVI